ncbi:hypothetical protein E0H89_16270 [Acinetobacter sp. ANC 3781]|uniref:hypothetical protein n=1 Tax=Acinetobacter sp. ANC 3781 TaxID=2529835 RepID=UPI0010390D33|nr:hypothetical protein [Acinetobacter sp. ANC 3781]TCB70202.1 hypothetical protein E0H89_16270 [Acinetobacter sp. ANC 3781]
MNHLTPADLSAITSMFINISVIAVIFSLMIVLMIQSIYRKIIRHINFPHRIKTEEGYLYRSVTGLYATKQRCEDILFEKKLKRRKFYIGFHRSMLKRLDAERVSTSDSDIQNS